MIEGSMVTVPVIKSGRYEGRTLHVGDEVTVEPVVAAVLARLGLVSLSVGYRTRHLEAGPPAAVPERTPRRRARRRKATAEPGA